MGFIKTSIALLMALSLFCLPKKVTKKGLSRSRKLTGRDPMLPRAIQPAPRWAKKASALFFWLVLRTTPYDLIINILRLNNPVVYVIITKSMKTAIVTGATGLIGTTLIRQLMTDRRYNRIYILARRTTGIQHVKIKEYVIDFEKLSDYPEAFSGDDLFCCLGTTLKVAGSAEARRKIDRDLVIAVAKAVEGRVKQFVVVSSVGADAASGNAYLRDKGEMENAIAAMHFENVIILQPSFFYGDRQETRIGEQLGIIMTKLLNPLMGKYKALPAEKVAAAMITYANLSAKGLHRIGTKEMK